MKRTQISASDNADTRPAQSAPVVYRIVSARLGELTNADEATIVAAAADYRHSFVALFLVGQKCLSAGYVETGLRQLMLAAFLDGPGGGLYIPVAREVLPVLLQTEGEETCRAILLTLAKKKHEHVRDARKLCEDLLSDLKADGKLNVAKWDALVK